MPVALLVRQLRGRLAGPFDLELGAGACAAISGPSGSGKTIFLRMIADLDPNEGQVWLLGRERASMPVTQWRANIIYLPAQSGWWADTVIEHFPPQRRGEVEELIGRLGLAAELLAAPVSQLSTGETQRFAIARALVLDPPVLLLDEPTGSLDQDSVARVEALICERMAAHRSVLLVTHDPGQAERLGHQRYRMAAGRLGAA